MSQDPRALLERLIQERGEDYAGLSRLIGRNPAYVQQYIKRGTPKRLSEEDRQALARYFRIDEALLGAPERARDSSSMVAVPRLDVGASAGAGAEAGEERALGEIAFDQAWFRRMRIGGGASAARLSMIRVQGDSMTPTLSDGDEIMVDRGDAAERLRDGIYVLRIDDALVVKRVARNPGGRGISVLSDNPHFPSWPECDPAAVDVVGRVVWVGRRLL
jgi:phage repressor protein C with HTH and peptisase S24 domain